VVVEAVEAVEVVDEIDDVVVVDVCGALDRMVSEIGVDICSFAKARGFFWEGAKMQQGYLGYAILQTKFRQLDLSVWNKYEFEHITNMDLPTKPAANLFFKFSRWRSFGIWAEIGNMEEEATEQSTRFGSKSSFGSSRASTRCFTANKPNAAVASSSPVSKNSIASMIEKVQKVKKTHTL
jgi:hypothetical protein